MFLGAIKRSSFTLTRRKPMPRTTLLARVAFLAITTLSCGDSTGPVEVATVAVSPTTAVIMAGETQSLNAVARDASGTALADIAISWSTSATTVATVANGMVTALTAGVATITATAGGKSGSATITVIAPVANVTVSPASATLSVGATQQFTASTTSAAGDVLTGRSIAWSTSNANVATVNASSGMATAVAAGTATITASSEGKSGSAALTVPVPVASVVVSAPPATILVGATAQLAATTQDAAGTTLTGRAVAWSSSNTNVATVSATGLVTGVAAGAATITATSEGKTGAASVTVIVQIPVAAVTVTPGSATVGIGATTQLQAALKSASGDLLSGRTVTWSTSNSAVATVSASGVVAGLADGAATITVTSEGKSGSASINVTSSPVTTLRSGIAITGLAGAEDSYRYYSITVPTGATKLEASISGGTGDADLYKRFNALPRPATEADNCDVRDGNQESCTVTNPTAGEWYFLIYGFDPYTAVTLTVAISSDVLSPGFTLRGSASTVLLPRSASGNLSVGAVRTDGFAGAISLAVEGLPVGVTASPTTIVSEANSATLTFVAGATAAIGTTTVTVRGKATGLVDRTFVVPLTVTDAQSITVALRETAITIKQADQRTVLFDVATSGGVTGPVELFFEDAPNGMTGRFIGESALTINSAVFGVEAQAPAGGTYNVHIRARAAGAPDAVATLAVTIATPSVYRGGFSLLGFQTSNTLGNDRCVWNSGITGTVTITYPNVTTSYSNVVGEFRAPGPPMLSLTASGPRTA